MTRQFVAAMLALPLVGCGVPDFFDQHPPNVRDARALDDVELASARPRAEPPTQSHAGPPDDPASLSPSPAPEPPVANAAVSAPLMPSEPAVPVATGAAATSPLDAAVSAGPVAPSPAAAPAAPMRSTADAPPVAPAPVPPAPVAIVTPVEPRTAPADRNAHCEAVASSRADDAAANGLDEALQKAVRDGTYASCVAWATAHPATD